jgi:hypothetical protein
MGDSKVYRLDKPSGEYPEGSPLHGTTYATVYLNHSELSMLRLGSLRTHPDGTFSAEANETLEKGEGFTSELAAVEWMLRQMLESGRWTADTALIALAKL